MGVTSWLALKKGKPEVKKLELEGESEIVDAAHLNLESAQLSTRMLMDRIEELKRDIDAEKKARQEDRLYFTRRVKEIDREARDLRNWAAKLAKQVIEAGKVPAPFISSSEDSDPLIQAIDLEKKQLEQTKAKREQEIRDAKSGD